MKANELMIGDWVEYRFTGWTEKGGVYKDYQYVQISTTGKLYVKADNDRVVSADGEEFFPIPITPDILEENGFENDFYVDESVADYVKVRLEGYSLRCKANGWDDALVTWCNGHLEVVTDFNGEVRKDIDHIHELQHALRLCGIDKEIEL